MIQFTAHDIQRFKDNEHFDSILALLESKVVSFMEHPIIVPEEGVGNWGHYFYCPYCSVELIYDLDKKHDHECPCCHKHFSDELKDGAWWRLTNEFNENAAMDIGRIHILTGETEKSRKAIDMMMSYAKYYPSYKPHGDIPYNGPGRLNAQTLDEANFLRNMGYAYDMLADVMSKQEQDFIKENLFRVGIEFLKENRHSQLHNHEVICNGAIGVLALILEDEESIDFAMNGRYGLVYQLENGTLEDGYWFECSTAYHFYALQNFFFYEKFARHTGYSNLSNPKYLEMIKSILRIQKDDLSFPLLNDSHVDQGYPNAYNLFEFAYATWKDEHILEILYELYRNTDRLSIESFFYGVDKLPNCPVISQRGNLVGEGGLGVSIIRRKCDYLLFRHGPYGGEHDHYDRLGISYYFDNHPVSIDIGTTGYGAPLHYAYYKKTNTHNTVVINNGNQAPSAGKLESFIENEDSVIVKASVEWCDDYAMPDSFTILQWDEESYRHVRMERTIMMTDEGFLDLMKVDGAPVGSQIDLNMHFHGEMLLKPATEGETELGSLEPYSFFHDIESVMPVNIAHSVFENEGITTDVFYSLKNTSGIVSKAYDNPSNKDMHYITRRSVGPSAVYMAFISSGRKDRVVDVVFDKDCLAVTTESGRVKTYRF